MEKKCRKIATRSSVFTSKEILYAQEIQKYIGTSTADFTSKMEIKYKNK